MIRVVLVVFVFVAGVPVSLTSGAGVRQDAPSGRIAVYDTSDGAILILSPSSGRVIARVRGKGYGDGDLSPSGRWIAFPASDGLVVQRVPAGSRRVIARCSTRWCPHSPSWDPTGQQVAFELNRIIYNVFSNGLGRTRVTSGEAPDLSPSTSEIVFVRDYSGYTNAGKIYVAAIDGADVRYVARGAHPAFHPSGTRIAYALGRDIYSVSLSGEAARRVIRKGAYPVWSPGGRYIAFTRDTSCGHAVCSGRVFIAPAAGGKARAIGPEIADIGSLSWSR